MFMGGQFDRKSLEDSIKILEDNPYSLLAKCREDPDPYSELREDVSAFMDMALRRRFYAPETILELEKVLDEKQAKIAGICKQLDTHDTIDLGQFVTKRAYKRMREEMFSDSVHPLFAELTGVDAQGMDVPCVLVDNKLIYNGKRMIDSLTRNLMKGYLSVKGVPDNAKSVVETFSLFTHGAYKERAKVEESVLGQKEAHSIEISITPNKYATFVNTLIHEEAHRWQREHELLCITPILKEGHAFGVTEAHAERTENMGMEYYTRILNYVYLLGTYDGLCSTAGRKPRKFQYEKYITKDVENIPIFKRKVVALRLGLEFDGEEDVSGDAKENYIHRIGQAVMELLRYRHGNSVLSDILSSDYQAVIEYIFDGGNL